MAPLVWGERETMRQMLWYNVILIALTLLPFTFGAFGIIYLVSAIVLGVILLAGVVRILRAPDWTKPAWTVTKFPCSTSRCCSWRWSSTERGLRLDVSAAVPGLD